MAFATMITLWIGLPWLGRFIISRPPVESSSVLHQLERWVICHWPPENSASSTLCYKFTSSCYAVKAYCHSAADWQVKVICRLHAGVREMCVHVCVFEREEVKVQGSIRYYFAIAVIHLLLITIKKKYIERFPSLFPECTASKTANTADSLLFLTRIELLHSNVRVWAQPPRLN